MTICAFYKKILRTISTLIVSSLLTSCVTYVYPQGKWVEPVDLTIKKDSLTGVVVKVTCKNKSGGDISGGEACRFIKKTIGYMSADGDGLQEQRGQDSAQGVTANEQGKPADIVVTYREVDSDTGMCGWSLIGMLLSGSVFPCQAEATSQASLTVLNLRTSRERTWPLKVLVRRYYGIGALAGLLSDIGKPLNRKEYQRQQAVNFMKFVQNKVYTASVQSGGNL
jgi:hypothetical protein